MKIVQVCHRYIPNIGGTENFVRDISERLAEQHDVTVISADRSHLLPGSEIINNVRIIRLNSIAPFNAYYFAPRMPATIRKIDADIVHAHNYHAFPALFASSIKKGKFIFSPYFHGKGSTKFRNILNKPYSIFGEKIFNRANKIICVSEFEKNLIIGHFPKIDVNKMVVIPIGIPIKEITDSRPFKIKGKILLYIGRLDQYKNLDLILKAMVCLPDICFIIIGSSGNYQKELIELIARLNISDRVKILNSISDKDKYSWLKSCSLFINLSGTESFGISVLEALAANKPVIANNNGGLSDFVRRFDAVTPVDVDAIKDEQSIRDLAYLINEKMQSVVKSDVSEYGMDSILRKIESVYEQ